MPRKLIDVFMGLPLLIASLLGGLLFLSAFAGHPSEWILDAYYSILPKTPVGGVIGVFALIGIFSLCLFGIALVLIFRRSPTSKPTGGGSTHIDTHKSGGSDT
jgi:hypothetical protein